MYRIKAHPTAGGIPNIFDRAIPGALKSEEKHLLRELAKQVVEIAGKPEQQEKRELWYAHNSLKKVRPMILVFPEDSWYEILNPDNMTIGDMYWRQYEWYLKSVIYRDKYIKDDYVIESDIYVPSIFYSSGWGIEAQYSRKDEGGSFHWDPPIQDPDDISMLKYPEMSFDKENTQKNFEMVKEAFDGILPVHLHGITRFGFDIVDTATSLRGTEILMMDIYDRPEWVHQLFGFIAEGFNRNLEWYENNGHLNMNNRNHYNGSGDIGYTNELSNQGGDKVRLKDMWGHIAEQAFSEVSPMHHEEFLFKYEVGIMEKFGLSAYGCCEPLTHKFDLIKKIPNLRRVSVSPWCDVNIAAEQLQDKYIYSWKPNPSYVTNKFDPDFVRKYIADTLKVTKNNVFEMVLKDTITLENEPSRIAEWVKIAREEIHR